MLYPRKGVCGISGKHSFTLNPSLDPYGQNHRQKDDFVLVGLGNLRFLQVHSLHVGWRNLFSSCAVVSVFCSGRKQVLVLHSTYVLRLPYSCGVVLVFLVLVGNCYWCYVHTQCTIQLCGCVSFFVVAGKLILYEYLTVMIVSQKYRELSL